MHLKRSIGLGVAALVLYLGHVFWFGLHGPPAWVHGVATRSPEGSTASASDAREPTPAPREPLVEEEDLAPPTEVAGAVVGRDLLPAVGLALVRTRDEAGGSQLYLHARGAARWRELAAPGWPVAEAALVVDEGDRPALLLVRSNPWWPYSSHYMRFWMSLARPELRPEHGLYLAGLEEGAVAPRYLGPGAFLRPAPDRRATAFLRADTRHGFYSIHLWRAGAAGGRPLTVASLWEADPGSGVSFDYSWSADGRLLFVRGRSRGFDPSGPGEPRELRLAYDVAADRLVEPR